VSRLIPGTPKDVLAALGQVFTTHPSKLELVDTVNGHPLDGGIMRFRMPRFKEAYVNPLVATDKSKQLAYRLEQIELYDLNVTLQARGTAATPACEVVITGDLRPGLLRNLALDYALMGLFGTFMALAGGLGAVKAAGGLSAIAFAVGGGGFLFGAGAVFVWYRWLFRGALKQAMNELGTLLQGVEQQLATRRLFSGESATGSATGAPALPWSTTG
jgi:hypothetical protein